MKDEAIDRILQLKYEVEQYHKAEAERMEKIERVDKQLTVMDKKVDPLVAQKHLVSSSISKKKQIKHYVIFQTDLLIQNLQSANKYALRQLMNFGENHPDMEPLIKRYAEQYRVDLPAKKPSITSSSLSSLTSSRSVSCLTKSKSPSGSQHSNNVSVASVVLSFDSPAPVKPKVSPTKGKRKK